MQVVFVVYAVLFALALFASAALLSRLGDGWVIFGMIFGGTTLAGLRVLWVKLNQIDEKLDELLKKRDEHDV